MSKGNPQSPPALEASGCGILLVDKPAGPTSHDLVAAVRRLTGVKKAGHGGTLDPFATGLVILLIGRATRLFDFLAPLDKRYRVTVRFGATSSTGDSEGRIEPVDGKVEEEQLRLVLPEFTGVISQRPPRYSAVKVGGEPLYRRARRGEKVQAPPRLVTIHELRLAEFDAGRQVAVLDVCCSKGTYIRSLCRDIGTRVGTGAYATALRRTSIGKFTAGEAIMLDRMESLLPRQRLGAANPSFISCFGALYFLPVREVDKKEAGEVLVGKPLPGEAAGPVRIARQGRLLAVYGPADAGGALRPLVVLA